MSSNPTGESNSLSLHKPIACHSRGGCVFWEGIRGQWDEHSTQFSLRISLMMAQTAWEHFLPAYRNHGIGLRLGFGVFFLLLFCCIFFVVLFVWFVTSTCFQKGIELFSDPEKWLFFFFYLTQLHNSKTVLIPLKSIVLQGYCWHQHKISSTQENVDWI